MKDRFIELYEFVLVLVEHLTDQSNLRMLTMPERSMLKEGQRLLNLLIEETKGLDPELAEVLKTNLPGIEGLKDSKQITESIGGLWSGVLTKPEEA